MTATALDPDGHTGISLCFPAKVYYHTEYGYFVQVGRGEDAEWFDDDGNQIDRDELFIGQFLLFHTGAVMGFVTRVSEAVDWLNRRYSPKTYASIHLADDEWGNETMFAVAEEFFREHPEEDFVEVYEHAGWFLGYRRDGSIWNTANDMATLNVPYPQPTGPSGIVIRR
jgi:hypothetical protein